MNVGLITSENVGADRDLPSGCNYLPSCKFKSLIILFCHNSLFCLLFHVSLKAKFTKLCVNTMKCQLSHLYGDAVTFIRAKGTAESKIHDVGGKLWLDSV